jgi:hypothetical protein
MTQLFNDVKITGVADVPQLTILANATQVTNPIQVWQDSSGNPLLRVSGDGRLQIGNNIALGSADALINANYNPSGALPTSVWHAAGVLNVPTSLAGTVNWVDHELQLTGAGTVNGVQTALYSKLTNSTTGNAGTADLRAATFQAVSSGGGTALPVGKVTAVRAIASNAVTGGSAYLSQAIGVEATISNDAGGSITAATAFSVAAPSNNGSIGTMYGLKMPDLTQGSANYALYTGQGIVHVGDVLETPVLASTPTSIPPANFVQLYTKLLTGAPQLYAKTSSGTEYLVGGGGSGGAPTTSKYLLQVADGSLPNAQSMGALGTGLVKNTTTTGVQSIAAAGTDYTSPTGTENLTNKTISASTINNSAIGTTTPSTGAFSNLTINAGGYIRPSADSTTALAITKADGTTPLIYVDSVNSRLGINTYLPGSTLSVSGDNGTTFNIGLDVRGLNSNGSMVGISQTGVGAWGLGMLAGQSDFTIYNNRYNGNWGTEVLRITSGNQIGINTNIFGTNNKLLINPFSTVDNLATMQINSAAATNKGLVVQGFASQTANLQEWQNSSGTVQMSIDPSGNLNVAGLAHLANVIEVPVQASTPAGAPPANFVRLYTKLNAGAPQLYAKDSTGVEYGLSGSGLSTVDNSLSQGRLTLSSGTPITTSDVTAATTVYFTPFRGNNIALYNGTSWALYSFTERSLSLASLAANTNFDLFLYNNAGTLTLEAIAWSSATVRATALVVQDGVYVKSGATSHRYLGTLRTTATTGQSEDSLRRRYIYNEGNQIQRPMRVYETVASWSYTTSAWRAANNNLNNRFEVVVGNVGAVMTINLLARATGSGSGIIEALGIDTTTNVAAEAAYQNLSGDGNLISYLTHPTALGYHYYQWVENGRGNTTATVFGFTSGAYQSGMVGTISL